MNKKCEQCTDSTKYVVGFWDGQDPQTGKPTHGCLYNCNSGICELKKQIDKKAADNQATIDEIKKKHHDRGVALGYVEAHRKQKEITIKDFSNAVGISASLYCDYRGHRKEIPQETYEAMIRILKMI